MTGDERQPRPRRLSTWTTRRWLRVGVAASLVVLALLGVAGALVMGRTQSISNNLTDVRSPPCPPRSAWKRLWSIRRPASAATV